MKTRLCLFNLPLPIFLGIAAVVLAATYLGVLPKGMTGCFAFMIVLGAIFAWVGDHAPIIKDYLGGGAIVCIFGSALLVYFGILPAAKNVDGQTVYNMALPFGQLDLVGNIAVFFKTEGGFLDWYVAALLTGSILGMNRMLLLKAAARYFPAIFGGLVLAFGLCMGVAAIMGYPVIKALLLIALPIMGGGMGAGATPLSKIFESSGSMTVAEALSVMTPAVAIGNAISIVLAGILVKVLRGRLNGNGALMQAGSVDPRELEVSPEMQARRDALSLPNMGIGLLASGAFFAWGFILAGAWKALGTGVTIHAYAWMIVTVAVCKIVRILPERVEIACFQWFQFVMKNLTNMLLVGIGICFLEIDTVIASFSVTYLLLCASTCIGAFAGAAIVGRLVGFYPFEAGITAGLCMSNMGGTGDVAVLSAAKRMELMPFAQISSRLGGAVILLLASLMLSVLARFITP
jgi:Na+/citrate or Na+/malate symporter